MHYFHGPRLVVVATAALALLTATSAYAATGHGAVPRHRVGPFGTLVRSHRSPFGAGWMSPQASKVPVAYVADLGDNVIDVYSQQTQTLVGQITTNVSAPYGLATDARGNLYVAEQDFFNVAVYAKGGTRPKLLLVDTNSPYGVAVSRTGLVFAGVDAGVDVFARGSATPEYTVTDPTFSDMYGVYLDPAGDLYFGGKRSTGGGQVSEVPAGSQGPGTSLNLKGLGLPLSMFFDAKGNLVVSDFDDSIIDVYAPGATSPSLQLTSDNVGYVAYNAKNHRMWSPAYGGSVVNILDYPSGATVASFTVAGPAVQLTGVALSQKRCATLRRLFYHLVHYKESARCLRGTL